MDWRYYYWNDFNENSMETILNERVRRNIKDTNAQEEATYAISCFARKILH